MPTTPTSIRAATLAVVLPLSAILHQPAPTALVYKHSAGGDLKLYRFAADQSASSVPHPAALWIHGGGWTGGTCDAFFPMARYTATRGAESFVVNYRLLRPGGPTMTDAIADCKSAVRYLRAHHAELNVDPQRIAVLGESAGGHLAAAVALLDDINDGTDDLTVSARPDAVVLFNPLTDFTASNFRKLLPQGADPESADAFVRDYSPLFHVRSGLPPTLCVHGLGDTVIPPEQTRRFAAALQQAGNRCDLELLPGLPHAFLIPEYKCSETVVVNAFRRADVFLNSLGWFSGAPTLTVSAVPAWTAKWPPSPIPAATHSHP